MKENNDKLPYIIGIAILLIVGTLLIGIDFAALAPGAVLSVDRIHEIDGVDYLYILVAENTYTGQTFYTESISEDVAGTNSDGNDISGTLKVDYNIKTNHIGWKTPLKSLVITEPYVSEVWAEDELIGRSIHTLSPDYFTYYQPSRGASVNADYTVSVTIDDTIYSLPSTPGKGQQQIPGTSPPIYWEEMGYVLPSGGNLPSTPTLIDVVIDEHKNVHFIKHQQTGNIVKIWTALFTDNWGRLSLMRDKGEIPGMPTTERIDTIINKRISLDADDDYEIQVDEGHIKFGIYDVINNKYRYRTHDVPVIGPRSIFYDFPDKNTPEYSIPSIDTTNLYFETSTSELKEDSTLTIWGRWKIPIEYGDVTVVTLYPEPQITNVPSFTEKIYLDTKTFLHVDVKNIGDDAGDINVWAVSTGVTTPVTLPVEMRKWIEPGKTKTFALGFIGSGVSERTDFDLTIYAQGGETTVSTNVKGTVYPITPITPDNSYLINIKSVNEEGTPLSNDFPITVSQTDDTQYGTWTGRLLPGTTIIYGEEELEINGITYYGEYKKVDITKDESFTLVYSSKPPTRDGDIYLYVAIIIAILMIVGAYFYTKE